MSRSAASGTLALPQPGRPVDPGGGRRWPSQRQPPSNDPPPRPQTVVPASDPLAPPDTTKQSRRLVPCENDPIQPGRWFFTSATSREFLRHPRRGCSTSPLIGCAGGVACEKPKNPLVCFLAWIWGNAGPATAPVPVAAPTQDEPRPARTSARARLGRPQGPRKTTRQIVRFEHSSGAHYPESHQPRPPLPSD